MTGAGALPDPFAQLRITSLRALRGANYWSRRPVTCAELDIGAYDDISSAQIPGFTERLLAALPGLARHECSVGRPGGLIMRLRRGTYAGHIAEHVALELQCMIGHTVGYGRTRGAGQPGVYTLVFAHRHEAVGLRTAALAVETVQHAIAGTAEEVVHAVASAVAELRALATTPDAPLPSRRVRCGITGGMGRTAVHDALLRDGIISGDDVTTGEVSHGAAVELSPASLLDSGLPYACSDTAVVLDTTLTDVPERYRDPERAARLVSVVVEAVPRGGAVICASDAYLVHGRVRDAGRRVVKFAATPDPGDRARRVVLAMRDALGAEHDVRHE